MSTSPRANSRADRILRLAVVARPIGNAECRVLEAGCSASLHSTFFILLRGLGAQTADVFADRDRRAEDRLGLLAAASPADARHPQLLQSGAPPNWHGVILVLRSAEIVVVVRANRQSSGDAGGWLYACRMCSFMRSLAKRYRRAVRSVTTRSRSIGRKAWLKKMRHNPLTSAR